ncbi:hypothetical protein JHK87_011256 [Glycine soja]|nr:hypothetical protein JHK87_011256 [Glycine soja]
METNPLPLPLILFVFSLLFSALDSSDSKSSPLLYDCDQCHRTKERDVSTTRSRDEKDVGIIATYSDSASGHVRLARLKMRDLSDSWIWENPTHQYQKTSREFMESFQTESNPNHSTDEHYPEQSRVQIPRSSSMTMTPMKIKRRVMRQDRRKARAAELTREDKENDDHIVSAAIEHTEGFDTTIKGKYGIWRREYENPNSDSTLKLMQDQIIMAKAYANIAKSKNKTVLYEALIKHSRDSQQAIGEASSDTELHLGLPFIAFARALDRAKAMGHVLSIAKDQLYDCLLVSRKLRAMLQSTEDKVNIQKKRSAFLIQLAAKTVPRPLHCLPLQLAANYYLQGYHKKGNLDKEKIEDPSLYHYAIFSDNVLAASVVVNSTVQNAKEPEKHVFHIVTDKLNFAAMRMWFLINPPSKATIEVQNVDDFKWLNSSYCSVLRQLESARIKEYYFKANHPSSLSNEDRTLWKLGTLPPGLITFYNLTYPLDRGWHVLGLGYDPALNLTEIENGAVIHYNGNYKPWLNLAVSKYKSYWSRYVMFDNPYLRVCNLSE